MRMFTAVNPFFKIIIHPIKGTDTLVVIISISIISCPVIKTFRNFIKPIVGVIALTFIVIIEG